MEFKVGDTVIVDPDLNRNYTYINEYDIDPGVTREMEGYGGMEAEIVDYDESNGIFRLNIDNQKYQWTEKMLCHNLDMSDVNENFNRLIIGR